jgi:hypothetical protein
MNHPFCIETVGAVRTYMAERHIRADLSGLT